MGIVQRDCKGVSYVAIDLAELIQNEAGVVLWKHGRTIVDLPILLVVLRHNTTYHITCYLHGIHGQYNHTLRNFISFTYTQRSPHHHPHLLLTLLPLLLGNTLPSLLRLVMRHGIATSRPATLALVLLVFVAHYVGVGDTAAAGIEVVCLAADLHGLVDLAGVSLDCHVCGLVVGGAGLGGVRWG